MRKILTGMALASAMIFASAANASLIIKVDEITPGDLDAAILIADNSGFDTSAIVGHIVNTSTTANFNIVTSVAFGSTVLTMPNIFDLAVNATTTGAGQLQVSLTETGFNNLDFLSLLGGGSIAVAGGTGLVQLFVGSTNGEFELSQMVASGSFGGGAFAIDTGPNDISAYTTAGDFSLTLVTTLTADSAGDFFSTDVSSVASIPEPSFLALMGLGLFGLGMARRNMNK